MTTRLVRGLVAAQLAVGALLPTSILFADNASADCCYSADCVPNVARNVTAGAPCAPQPRRAFAYGLEPTGGTVICNAAGTWASAGALIGVYNVLAYGTLQWGHRTD